MEWWQVIVLAIVQGLTEFLPISSSAYLILPSQVLGWPDQGLAFDVAVHFGSLFAILAYLRPQLVELTRGSVAELGARQWGPSLKLVLGVGLATLPAGLLGLVFDDWIETNLRSMVVIAIATIVFGLLLGVSERVGRREQPLGLAQIGIGLALVIGLAQAIALIPGTSRSGITMTAALFLGINREDSARFSFLLSIPLIVAAAGLKTLQLVEMGVAAHWGTILSGAAVSFVSAYLCVKLFMKFIDKIGFMPFVVYRLLLGAGLLALWASSAA